jgi:glycosyltransferase involved in cell wall biosynthesis
MRLLYISQYYLPEVGVTQTRAYEMARHLAVRGHQVTVLTEVPNHLVGIIAPAYRGRLFQRRQEDGLDVIRLWVKTAPQKSSSTQLTFYLSFMINATLAGLLLARGRYNLIHATSLPPFVGGVAWALNAMHRIPFVFEIRDLWPESAIAMGELKNLRYIRWTTWLEQSRCQRSCHIVTVTRRLRDRLIERGIADGKNDLLVPVGDVEALAEAIVYLLQNPQKRAEFRQQNLSLIQERANHQAEMAKMEALYYTLLESVSTQ